LLEEDLEIDVARSEWIRYADRERVAVTRYDLDRDQAAPAKTRRDRRRPPVIECILQSACSRKRAAQPMPETNTIRSRESPARHEALITFRIA
jgi:hypothetical protein